MKINLQDFIEKNKKFSFLRKLHIERKIEDKGAERYTLMLNLVDFPFHPGDNSLTILFSEVFNLKLGELEGLRRVVLEIKDVSIDQIEGAHYKVIDLGDSNIIFLCNQLEYKIGSD